MGIMLAIVLATLVLYSAARLALPSSDRHNQRERLTVLDIHTRLAAEPPRTYIPISRGW